MPFTDDEMKIEKFKNRYRLFIESITYLINKMKLKYKIKFKYLIFDKKTDMFVIESLKNNGSISIGDEYVFADTVSILDTYSSAVASISMRFHSLLLSILTKVPTLSISYAPKSHELLCEYSLEEVSIKYGIRDSEFYNLEFEIDENQLDDGVDYLFENRDLIIQKIEKANDDMKIKTELGFNLLSDLLWKKGR